MNIYIYIYIYISKDEKELNWSKFEEKPISNLTETR